jgi:hypothetical protein
MLPELQEVKERVEDFHNVYIKITEFLRDNEITDGKTGAYFLLMGVAWLSVKRKEEITDEDAEIWLNFEPGTVSGLTNEALLPGLEEVPLDEFLCYLKNTYFE